MCIVLFDWQPDSLPPLRMAATRDEFPARPAEPAERFAHFVELEWLDDCDDELHAFTPCVIHRPSTGEQGDSKLRAN